MIDHRPPMTKQPTRQHSLTEPMPNSGRPKRLFSGPSTIPSTGHLFEYRPPGMTDIGQSLVETTTSHFWRSAIPRTVTDTAIPLPKSEINSGHTGKASLPGSGRTSARTRSHGRPTWPWRPLTLKSSYFYRYQKRAIEWISK